MNFNFTLSYSLPYLTFSFTFCLLQLDSVSKKVHFSPHIQTDARQQPFQARGRLQPSGIWFMVEIFSFSIFVMS